MIDITLEELWLGSKQLVWAIYEVFKVHNGFVWLFLIITAFAVLYGLPARLIRLIPKSKTTCTSPILLAPAPNAVVESVLPPFVTSHPPNKTAQSQNSVALNQQPCLRSSSAKSR